MSDIERDEHYCPTCDGSGYEDATDIRGANPVDMALDPTWAARVAREALNPSTSGESEHAELGAKPCYPRPESFGEATGGK